MAASQAEILEAISNMTVMEVVDLISAMEEKFGVSAAAAVAAAPVAAAAEAGQSPLEYMRDRSAFAVPTDPYEPHERSVDPAAVDGCRRDEDGVYRRPGTPGAWSGA